MSEYPTGASPQPPRESQQQGTFQQGKEAARDVAGTARQQSAVVAGEAREQTRHAVEEIRERARVQAQHQSERAAHGIRQWADELSAMNDGAKPDSQVAGVVRQVADGGRRAADYLEQHGFAGVVSDVQDFARRRPAVFLAGALAAGFLVGRIAKATTGSQESGQQEEPRPAPNAFTGDTYETPYTDPEPYVGADPAHADSAWPVPAPGSAAPRGSESSPVPGATRPVPGGAAPPAPGTTPPAPGRPGDLP